MAIAYSPELESPLRQGPLLESGLLSFGQDYYKPTMSQLAYEHEPDAVVTFTLTNRGQQHLKDYIEPGTLQARLNVLRERGWQASEINYMAGLQKSSGEQMFSDDYLNFLTGNSLPLIIVEDDPESGDIQISTTGIWPLVTFWETVALGELNEAYFEGYVSKNNLDVEELYREGDRRLSEKITTLREHPGIKIAEFGTRRHFSLRWQQHVMERLQEECPENLVGTSNVGLASELGVRPVGTFAHELPMVYAGLAEVRGHNLPDSHQQLWHDWYDLYGNDLAITLTDTFTSDFFFDNFSPEDAQLWRGVRQDSGDPFAFGERLLDYYQANNIDPTTKTLVFSDGLDMDRIVALYEHFAGRIKLLFGWGTTLTNDLGVRPLNIVMKATHVLDPLHGETDTVKLSDDEGKHTGPADKVAHYVGTFVASKSLLVA